MENRMCLLNSVYEKDKARVVLYFGKDPLDKTPSFIYKNIFYPHFIIDIKSELVSELLSDFKREISIKSLETKTKILARDFETLQKTAKILQQATGRNVILIEPERQFLIKNNWSYYDSFFITKNKITKVNNEDFIHFAIGKFTNHLEENQKIKLIEPITKKLILSNILKIKPESNIKNDQILNVLFENEFFGKDLILKNTNNFYYQTKDKFIKEHINLDFSNVLPYLLTNKFNNVGYETINCPCCKPKEIFQDNVLSSSLVEVEFNKHGYYFVSCDDSWARGYHNTKEQKENRENYKKQNGLLKIPIGPFAKGQKEFILLSDAVKLFNKKDLKILNNTEKLLWNCKQKESFISRIINDLINKQQRIEESINISTIANYSLGDLKNSKNLERNPLYLQYLTEYSLINSLIEEIPKFLQHKNTKFYSTDIDSTIRSIKYNTLNEINKEEEFLVLKNKNIQIRNKKLLLKINQTFPKMNLPIPRLIVG